MDPDECGVLVEEPCTEPVVGGCDDIEPQSRENHDARFETVRAVTWVKVDDHIDEHPKLAAAAATVGDSAVATYVSALAYCNRTLTDGHIPSAVVRRLTHHRRPGLVADALVSAGLWTAEPDGYMIHDYLVYQPSKAEVLAGREETQRRVAEHRDRKREAANTATVTGDVTALQERYQQSRNGRCTADVPGTGKERTTTVESKEVDARARELCDQLSASCRQITQTASSSRRYLVTSEWLTDMDRLIRLDGRDPVKVAAAIRWAHQDDFWRRNILSPRKLREHYDKLRLAYSQPEQFGRTRAQRGADDVAAVNRLMGGRAA